MIINYKEEFEDPLYVNDFPDTIERIKHDKKLMD